MTGDEQPVDRYLAALANRNRRLVVTVLSESGDNWLDEAEVIDRLRDETQGTPDRMWRIELRHEHCPTLADLGIIEYDRENERLRYTGSRAVSELLDTVRRLDSEVDSGDESTDIENSQTESGEPGG